MEIKLQDFNLEYPLLGIFQYILFVTFVIFAIWFIILLLKIKMKFLSKLFINVTKVLIFAGIITFFSLCGVYFENLTAGLYGFPFQWMIDCEILMIGILCMKLFSIKYNQSRDYEDLPAIKIKDPLKRRCIFLIFSLNFHIIWNVISLNIWTSTLFTAGSIFMIFFASEDDFQDIICGIYNDISGFINKLKFAGVRNNEQKNYGEIENDFPISGKEVIISW